MIRSIQIVAVKWEYMQTQSYSAVPFIQIHYINIIGKFSRNNYISIQTLMLFISYMPSIAMSLPNQMKEKV